jgi:hypothetical protein
MRPFGSSMAGAIDVRVQAEGATLDIFGRTIPAAWARG